MTATPPPQGDFAVAELGASDDLGLVAADRQTFQTMAAAGAVVSKVPDAGGYRLQTDYAKPGWSSVMLITGRSQHPAPLLTQPAGRAAPAPGPASSTPLRRTRPGGWKVEMAWYDTSPPAPTSARLIPETQGAATNALLPATNGLVPGKPPPKKPAATGNALQIFDSDTAAANATSTPPADQGAAPAKGKGQAKTPPPAKSDIPL